MAIFLSIVALLAVVLIARGKAIVNYINTKLDVSSARQSGTWDGATHGRRSVSWAYTEEVSLRNHYSNSYDDPKLRDVYDAAFKLAAADSKAHQERTNQLEKERKERTERNLANLNATK